MPDKGRYLEWNEQRLSKWAAEIGPFTEEVIKHLFDSTPIREQALLPALSILKLTNKYTSTRLEDACELALTRIYSPRWKNLNSILVANQDEIVRNTRDKKALSVEGFLRDKAPVLTRETPGLNCETLWCSRCEHLVLMRRKKQ